MKYTNTISQYLKNVKPRDLVYPGALLLFIGIVIVVFFFAIRFISQNINRAFSPEDSGAARALDIERYTFIANKLNIPVNTSPREPVSAPQEPSRTEPAATSTNAISVEATSTKQVITLDKSTLTIMVKNSTTKKGVASTLAKALEDGGFQKPQTGNESGSYATTTLLLKESKRAYEALILDVVRGNYPDTVTMTSPENASSDAIIIIGAK